jgi:hypothetical protein
VDAGRIVVACEREVVMRIKPAVVGGAEGVEGTKFDLGESSLVRR